MKIGRLIVRVVIGGLFIGHGTQKLFGWFNGPGPEGAQQMMHRLNLHPTRRNALAAGVTETAGGALLVAGLATPLGAASLIGVMITAIRTVHLKKGLWAADGGYEYHLVLIAALLALVDGGPGELSADAALGIQKLGPAWALTALTAGAAASILTVELGHRAAPAPSSSDTTERIAGDPAEQRG